MLFLMLLNCVFNCIVVTYGNINELKVKTLRLHINDTNVINIIVKISLAVSILEGLLYVD